MYKNKKDFKDNIDFKILDITMTLKSVNGVWCYYSGKMNGNEIYIYVSMDNLDDSRYFRYENVFSLLDSDNILIYIGGKCILNV